jgi:hypothetical protein
MRSSAKWNIDLEDEETSFGPSASEDALASARQMPRGTLNATGDGGDCLQMQFNESHAMVLYMTHEGVLLRPHFPNRSLTGAGIEEYYCECCGVQLGDIDQLAAQCMNREEGISLCDRILHGEVPDSSDLTWVPLAPRLKPKA